MVGNRSLILAITLAIAMCGCHQSRPVRTMSLSPNETACHVEITKFVPSGTPSSDAIHTMEANGFKCSRREDERGAFIYCNLSEPKDQFVTSRWQVKLYIVDDAVSDVEVAYGTFGL